MTYLSMFFAGGCIGALVVWVAYYGRTRDDRTVIEDQARLLRTQRMELVAAHNAAAEARRQTMHVVRERRTA